MQTILTRYIGPGNVRGSRVKATSSSGKASVTLPWDSALSSEDCHTLAARALCDKLDWHGTLTGGEDKRGMVWVFTGACSPTITIARKPGL